MPREIIHIPRDTFNKPSDEPLRWRKRRNIWHLITHLLYCRIYWQGRPLLRKHGINIIYNTSEEIRIAFPKSNVFQFLLYTTSYVHTCSKTHKLTRNWINYLRNNSKKLARNMEHAMDMNKTKILVKEIPETMELKQHRNKTIKLSEVWKRFICKNQERKHHWFQNIQQRMSWSSTHTKINTDQRTYSPVSRNVKKYKPST